MDKSNGLTGVRKRQKISAANKAVFTWVVIASIVLGISGVVAQFMLRQLFFNNKILTVLNTTNSNIKKSITTYDGLKTEVTKLVADTNLNALKKGENSTALQVVIDALPTEENRVALATSMQNEVLGPSGVTINAFAVIDASTAAAASASAQTTSGVQSFSFNFTITGSYAQVQQAIRNIERSIRPIAIQSLDIQGTDTDMKVNIVAITYYQPPTTVSVKEEKLSP